LQQLSVSLTVGLFQLRFVRLLVALMSCTPGRQAQELQPGVNPYPQTSEQS